VADAESSRLRCTADAGGGLLEKSEQAIRRVQVDLFVYFGGN